MRKEYIISSAISLVIALIALILLLSGCAGTRPYQEWNTTDKVLFGSIIALNGIDAIQTSRCQYIEGCSEANPLLKRHDSKPDMLRVMGFKTLVLAWQYYALGRLPVESEKKTLALGVGTALMTGIVVSNAVMLRRSGYSGISLLLPILTW